MKLVHVNSFSGHGAAPSQFRVRITGLATGVDGAIYAVGDRDLKAFARDGEFIAHSATSDAAWSICAAGELFWIGLQGTLAQLNRRGEVVVRVDDAPRLGLVTGVAAFGDTVLAADATHKVLRQYRGGHWLRDVGLDVNTRGFMLPNGVLSVAVDQGGRRFVVAHPQKHRVERYELDGTPAGQFGRFGNAEPADFGGCCNPNTIAVLPDGKICVTEKSPPRIKVFTLEGGFLAATADGAFAAEAKNMALAAGAGGRLYAVDTVRLSIEGFDLVDD